MRKAGSSWMVIAFVAVVAVALAAPSFASAFSFHETSQSPLPNLTGVNAIATGDFDEDGDDDMAVADETGVVVEISDGFGTFTEGQTLPIEPQVNATASDVVVGDFNGDGKLDIAYTDGPYKLYIALGNGDGTFEAPGPGTEFRVPSYVYPGDLTAGELSGDGSDDIVLGTGAHYSSSENSGYEVIGYEAGAFTQGSLVAVSTPLESFVAAAAVGDFTGDGNQDLALLVQPFNSSQDNEIYGEEGHGDGTFTAAPGGPIALSGAAFGFALAETPANLDGTGGEDLLVAASGNNSTIPLLGSSDKFLTLNAGGALEDGPAVPHSVAAADLGGNGLDDAIPAYFDSNGSFGAGVSDGSGNLTAAVGSPYSVGQSGFFNSAIAVGDFNGDGYPDIVLGSNANTNGAPLTQGVAVLLNSAGVGVAPEEFEFSAIEVGQTAIADVTLTGLGVRPSEISRIELSGTPGSPFSLVNPSTCETNGFGEGEECEVEIEFAPTTAGESTDTLFFTTEPGPNGNAVVTEVPLSGEAIAPAATLDPVSQSFGSAQLGGPPVIKRFRIESAGGVPLSVTGVSLSAETDFKLPNPSACVGSILPGAICEVVVSFRPTGTAGARAATLTVETNAGTQTAQLSGTATVPASNAGSSSSGGDTTPIVPIATPAPTTAAKLKVKAPGTVKAGKTISLKVTITNSGGAALSGLALKVKVPTKLATAPKTVKVGSLGIGKSVTKTIKVKVKPGAAKGSKVSVALSAAAGGETLAKASGKVKVK